MFKFTQKLSLLFLLILLLVACNGQGPGRPGAEPVEEESSAEPGADEAAADPDPEPVFSQPALTIVAEGEIRNSQPALSLGFETGGRLVTLNVRVGDEVAAGDVIAVLDDKGLREAITSAELRLAQSENSLLKSQAELTRLLTWEPDGSAITIAEANIASAEANLANAQTQDSSAGSGLTQAQISIDQAERELANAQEKYDNAFSPGREWEVFYDEPICDPGEPPPCMGLTWAQRIKSDREFAVTRLQNAQEQLRIARANFQGEAGRINRNSAVSAEGSLIGAQEELARALKGPTAEEIAAAELNVQQAELSLEQEQFSLEQAQEAVDQATLTAPWNGTVLTVDVTTGAFVGAGSPVVTLIDTAQIEFHTTNLSERDLDQIEIGQVAEITLKSYPNDPISGRVARIGLQATGVLGDAAVFPVIIALEPENQVVRSGMTGTAEILREAP